MTLNVRVSRNFIRSHLDHYQVYADEGYLNRQLFNLKDQLQKDIIAVTITKTKLYAAFVGLGLFLMVAGAIVGNNSSGIAFMGSGAGLLFFGAGGTRWYFGHKKIQWLNEAHSQAVRNAGIVEGDSATENLISSLEYFIQEHKGPEADKKRKIQLLFSRLFDEGDIPGELQKNFVLTVCALPQGAEKNLYLEAIREECSARVLNKDNVDHYNDITPLKPS